VTARAGDRPNTNRTRVSAASPISTGFANLFAGNNLMLIGISTFEWCLILN
jgi:hypothetical protein